MAELKNWYIHYDYGEFIAHGLAYGRASYKFGDGAGVHTSPISSVEIDESGLHIQTRNTLYFLDKDFINVDQHDDSLNALAQEFFKDDPELFLSNGYARHRRILRKIKLCLAMIRSTLSLSRLPTVSFIVRCIKMNTEECISKEQSTM